MYRVYTKEQKSKEVFNINLDASELQAVMGGNVFLDHPELNKDDYIIVQQEQPFTCPLYNAETNTIDEATREQRILIFNETELLQDGEYIENEKIIFVPAPEEFFRKVWDKELHIWKEGTTEEEFIEMRKNKILKYSKLEENKKALESSKFSSTDEIQMIIEEMTELEKEINTLAEKIKTFKI